MKKKIILILMATLCFFLKAIAQGTSHELKPLSIGDTLPAAVWNRPLQVINYQVNQQSIKLKDYKRKGIILDFWATWCSSCINHFLMADSLEKQFDHRLQIILVNSITGTGDTEAKVNTFFKNWNSNHNNRLAMPSIYGDTILKQLFPHSFIPHYIWIAPDGKITAITSSEEVTSQNVEKLINGTELHLPIKKH